jgi:gamma-glutamylcyclotransferase (GGCT)/AIG2-like uncharacterized protein YtfP
MSDLLFVYGTLRRRCRHPMAAWLAGRATFLGEAMTPGQLHDLGRFPGAIPATAEGDWLYGDLYDLGPSSETWAGLDLYENGESPSPAYFERRLTKVFRLPDRQPFAAWLYWFVGPMPTSPPPVRIASGRYEVNFFPPES